jgi:metal-sulfur cluster biosynthetic enzyme
MSSNPDAPNHVAEEIGETAIAIPAIYDQLREVYDPEIPVNIVDLGLVYALKVEGGDVSIIMTLTSIGCPVGPEVMAEVEERLREVDGVENVDVTLTFDPPWNTERMTEDAKWELGVP